LKSIQDQYASTGTLADEDRSKAFDIQAALNVTRNGEYAAPALLVVRPVVWRQEVQRLARETRGGPFGTHRPLIQGGSDPLRPLESEKLTILFNALEVVDARIKSQILALLRPFGLDLKNAFDKGRERDMPDHIARIIEYLVAHTPT